MLLKKILKNKKVINYFFFLSILIFLLIVKFRSDILLKMGELSFLKFYKYDLAVRILKLNDSTKDLRNLEKTYFLLGRIYFVQNKLYDSIYFFNKTIQLNNENKEAYYGRGLSYGYLGEKYYKDAEEDFLKYIELDEKMFQEKGYHSYGAWAGYNDLAWIYFLMGDFQKTEKVSREAIIKFGENPWLLNMLGTSLLAQKKCLDAKTYLNDSLILMDKMSVESFGEAYTGDNKDFWKASKESMRKTIEENIELCNI